MFLIEYQKAARDGENRPLEESYQILLDVLQKGDAEPIPIVLEETSFNSDIHIIRTITHNNSLPNGVIVRVSKNGFRENNGTIIQPPEVIVNRV